MLKEFAPPAGGGGGGGGGGAQPKLLTCRCLAPDHPMHDYSSLAQAVMRVRILPARRANLVDACRCVLKSGHLSPGAAASLRGKLYFAATAAYGKVGRAALQPGLQRQEQSGDSNRLTPSLVLSLRFFITLLNNMPTRKLLTP